MDDEAGNTSDGEDPDADYLVGRPDPETVDYEPRVYPIAKVPGTKVAPSEDRLQFSLRELFLVITLSAIPLSLIRFFPPEHSTQVLAGAMGVGLVIGRLVLWAARPRSFFYVVWWVTLVLYVLLSVTALVTGEV